MMNVIDIYTIQYCKLYNIAMVTVVGIYTYGYHGDGFTFIKYLSPKNVQTLGVGFREK